MVVTVIVHFSRYQSIFNLRDIYSCVTNRDELPSALNGDIVLTVHYVVDQSPVFCIIFYRPLVFPFVFCSFDHCIFCSSTIYASDFPIRIFNRFVMLKSTYICSQVMCFKCDRQYYWFILPTKFNTLIILHVRYRTLINPSRTSGFSS